MAIIPGSLGRHSWDKGEFHPKGRITFHGEKSHFERNAAWRKNPTTRTKQSMASVRFFIGFNVGKKARWKESDVIKMVRDIRERQVGDPGATFLSQKGMYLHHGVKAKKGTVVVENGVQVYIVNLPHFGASTEEFRDQMEEMADELVNLLEQEAIFAQWQYGSETESWETIPTVR